jgi:hypothetical protein
VEDIKIILTYTKLKKKFMEVFDFNALIGLVVAFLKKEK